MNKSLKAAILFAVVVGIAAAYFAGNRSQSQPARQSGEETENVDKTVDSKADNSDSGDQQAEKLPKMVELGSVGCIPCKMMEPVLEELETKYSESLEVEFIDIYKNEEKAAEYDFEHIPTQVFLAPDGGELFQHTGYFSTEQIIEKWKELGYDFEGKK